MLDPRLLEILCCPESRQALALAPADLLVKVNAGIASGAVKNRAGRPVAGPLVEALLSQDGKRLYPVVEGIPVMLVEESITL